MLAFIDLEERVPAGHPLRTIKRLADEGLADAVSVWLRVRSICLRCTSGHHTWPNSGVDVLLTSCDGAEEV